MTQRCEPHSTEDLFWAPPRPDDADMSGWFDLVSFMPYIGWIVLTVVLAFPPKPSAWRYDTGRPPASD
ncbi:DUF805 domain-containing protein [Acidipropionibacterium virtanenii]|uniref:Uncharacterized protein n=1 Tax=Acidipropionibacterium virtanenii TaxID=2057246 RepID=A0A344UTK5_9ACTN|nr:DUF805 domain-containing protein [Acidipropionibacterium virtanenii]AXE38603.1 hypothetical protein JS278_01434 [Acidipropionibacterium virtanenii]